jgi:hypothetical protein
MLSVVAEKGHAQELCEMARSSEEEAAQPGYVIASGRQQ